MEITTYVAHGIAVSRPRALPAADVLAAVVTFVPAPGLPPGGPPA